MDIEKKKIRQLKMEIKRSDLKLNKFTMLACNFATIPFDTKVSSESLKNIPIDIDFDILTNNKNSSKIKIILEFHSNEGDKPLAGYMYSIVAEAEYNIKGLGKMSVDKRQRYILFTALPLAIAMVRSHLYSVSSTFPHGHYLMPSIDLPDLFEKKFSK